LHYLYTIILHCTALDVPFFSIFLKNADLHRKIKKVGVANFFVLFLVNRPFVDRLTCKKLRSVGDKLFNGCSADAGAHLFRFYLILGKKSS